MKGNYKQSDWLMITIGIVTIIDVVSSWLGAWMDSRIFIFNASNAKEINAMGTAMHLIFIPTLEGTLISILIMIVSFLRLKKFLILFLLLSPYTIINASLGIPELMKLDFTNVFYLPSNILTITSFLFVGLSYYTFIVWCLENYKKRKDRNLS